MCPPVIMGIGLAMMVASAAMGAVTSIQSGNAAAAQAKQQAEYIDNANQVQAADRARRRDALIGQQAALYGASGLDASAGTPADVYASTAADFGSEQYQADIGAANQAAVTKADGKNAAISASNQAFRSLIGTAGKAMTMMNGGYGGTPAAGTQTPTAG